MLLCYTPSRQIVISSSLHRFTTNRDKCATVALISKTNTNSWDFTLKWIAAGWHTLDDLNTDSVHTAVCLFEVKHDCWKNEQVCSINTLKSKWHSGWKQKYSNFVDYLQPLKRCVADVILQLHLLHHVYVTQLLIEIKVYSEGAVKRVAVKYLGLRDVKQETLEKSLRKDAHNLHVIFLRWWEQNDDMLYT
jgi:hypothetical protein